MSRDEDAATTMTMTMGSFTFSGSSDSPSDCTDHASIGFGAAALAFFAMQPRYIYDLADQQHRSTRSTDDAFADPDHKLVLQCGTGDMDSAVQRFCYPPGGTATTTPHVPHPLVVVTAGNSSSSIFLFFLCFDDQLCSAANNCSVLLCYVLHPIN